MSIDTSKYRATIVTAKGDIEVTLDARAAPRTVNNFVFLARDRFYDGLTFHRVEQGLRRAGRRRPDSAGSEFYIMLGAQPDLDGRYTVSGKVTGGRDVARRIAKGDLITRILVTES